MKLVLDYKLSYYANCQKRVVGCSSMDIIHLNNCSIQFKIKVYFPTKIVRSILFGYFFLASQKVSQNRILPEQIAGCPQNFQISMIYKHVSSLLGYFQSMQDKPVSAPDRTKSFYVILLFLFEIFQYESRMITLGFNDNNVIFSVTDT